MRPDFSRLLKGGQDGKILQVRKVSERLLRRARPSGVAPFIHLTTPRGGLTRTVFRRAKTDRLSPHFLLLRQVRLEDAGDARARPAHGALLPRPDGRRREAEALGELRTRKSLILARGANDFTEGCR